MHVLIIPFRGDRGYTDGRVRCRKPVEEPGTVPQVRIGNVVALLIGPECPNAYKLCALRTKLVQSISVMAAFENGEPGNDEETGALDLGWQLNAGTEFGYYNFSKEVNARSHAALLESENPGNVFWATGKGYELADTSDATVSLLEKAESCGTDFTAELAAYRAAYTRLQQLLAETAAAETEAMQALAEQLAA